MKSPDGLAGIGLITNVGAILVPQSLATKLLLIPMTNVGLTLPIADGEHGKPDDILLI